MKSTKRLTALLAIVLIALSCHKNNSDTPPKNSNLRVLGYMYSDYNWNNDLAGIDLTALTDLNLAFINPDAEGHFPVSSELFNVVQKAHNANVRVFLSLGGAAAPAYIPGLIAADKRAAVIEELAGLTTIYGFDGIDVDLEGDLIDDNYGGFIADLSVALKAGSKLMTAALATWNADQISDETLGHFDFINIMSYDLTGPWDPSNPGQHSPFSMARDDFNYFNTTRHISSEKLFIGVPFYGHGFGTNAPDDIAYKDILAQYPGAENKDEVDVAGGGKIYYNGRQTIHDKVIFAIENKVGGVMIWELHQDVNDARSLLKVINETKN
jgi:chitinase